MYQVEQKPFKQGDEYLKRIYFYENEQAIGSPVKETIVKLTPQELEDFKKTFTFDLNLKHLFKSLSREDRDKLAFYIKHENPSLDYIVPNEKLNIQDIELLISDFTEDKNTNKIDPDLAVRLINRLDIVMESLLN